MEGEVPCRGEQRRSESPCLGGQLELGNITPGWSHLPPRVICHLEPEALSSPQSHIVPGASVTRQSLRLMGPQGSIAPN